ncbi:GSCFA domain-containing protein [Vreelandella titanicae]|uniref:GSCFA domain-containing protein n=1 Tax=Vreelandella titanicae TaxID=664683 RepID=UPI0037F71D62
MPSIGVVVFGSCLSGQIAKRLAERDYTYVGALRHIRSDVLIEAASGNALTIEKKKAEIFIDSLGFHDEKAVHRLKDRLLQNTKEKLKSFVQSVKNADVVLFDNQYDLERPICNIEVDGEQHLVSNFVLNHPDVKCKKLGIMPESRFGLYNDLYSFILQINPKIKFVFIQYPVLEGERLEVTGRSQRVKRSLLTSTFRSSWQFSSIPLYKVDVEYAGKNINHFKPSVYDALAEVVDSLIKSGESPVGDVKFLSGFERHNGKTPYSALPDRQYWKPAVAEPYPLAITDLYRKKFDISIEDGVATCGSCFAQHIGKRLDRKGYNYLDVEPVPADLAKEKAKALGYGIYSARYGNVYTSRQLVQLFDRAFGALSFDEVWQDKAGRYVDPFRPNLCGEGYTSAAEVLEEQQKHLQNVRHMFETLDVFVFTMGVTETWINRQTGAVYPICPGVTAGTFDPNTYEFVNLDYATILDEMETFLSRLREVNPKAKVLLTVSPVPLTATAEERHVLLSTMASKSILRAVADQLYRRHAHVDYFPSYDIIMSPPFKSMFFKNNLRSIHEEGVDYVMSHFFAEHQLEGQPVLRDLTATGQETADEAKEEEDDEAFCDEAFLELERKTNQE